MPITAERLPQRANLNVEIFLHHDDAGPDAMQKFVFADGSSIGFEQHQEQIKGACVKFDRRSVSQQLPSSWPYAEPAKLECPIGFGPARIEHRGVSIGVMLGPQGR